MLLLPTCREPLCVGQVQHANEVHNCVRRLRRAYRHPTHVRRRAFLESEGPKDRRANDIASLYFRAHGNLSLKRKQTEYLAWLYTMLRSALSYLNHVVVFGVSSLSSIHLLIIFVVTPRFFEWREKIDVEQRWVRSIFFLFPQDIFPAHVQHWTGTCLLSERKSSADRTLSRALLERRVWLCSKIGQLCYSTIPWFYSNYALWYPPIMLQ